MKKRTITKNIHFVLNNLLKLLLKTFIDKKQQQQQKHTQKQKCLGVTLEKNPLALYFKLREIAAAIVLL